MNSVLTDLSVPALKQAIYENLWEFCCAAARLPQGEFSEDGSFTRWTFGVPYPWWNAVLARRPGAESDRRRVQETIEYFRSKQIGSFTWWLAPGLVPTDWESILGPLGFEFSSDVPGMAANLDALNEEIPTPEGLTLLSVGNEATLKTWVEVFLAGYGLPKSFKDSVYQLLLNLGFDGPSRNYLAVMNGRPVATSNVFLGAGVAGIQMVATLPEARGRGIGAAVTLQPLLDARKLGYRAGILQSSDQGFPVYRRLGFEHLCQMEYFFHHG